MKRRRKKILLKILRWGIVVAAIIFALWVNSLPVEGTVLEDYVQRLGYVGLLLVSIVSGFNVIVPVPVAAFSPLLLEAGMHPVLMVAVISLGMMMGDVLGYVIGRTGRRLVEDRRVKNMIDRLERLKEKPIRSYIFLAIYSAFIPLPNELIVIPMGMLRYKWWAIFLTLFIGNITFNIVVSSGFHLFS